MKIRECGVPFFSFSRNFVCFLYIPRLFRCALFCYYFLFILHEIRLLYNFVAFFAVFVGFLLDSFFYSCKLNTLAMFEITAILVEMTK